MRIHSSSLTFSPIGRNQQVGKDNSAQNKDQNEPYVTKDAQNKASNPISTPEEIKKTLGDIRLSVDSMRQNNIQPINSRTLRALSAYTQEFNAPLQEQRAQLLTGIDAYA
jgi:hypothetical protein